MSPAAPFFLFSFLPKPNNRKKPNRSCSWYKMKRGREDLQRDSFTMTPVPHSTRDHVRRLVLQLVFGGNSTGHGKCEFMLTKGSSIRSTHG